VELIEIKTPLGGRLLFNRDPSHNTLYPGAELSKVSAQAEHYLAELDAERNSILRQDGGDVARACVTIIIRREGTPEQCEALHRHTAHLARIEVITFDGLLRIAGRVLSYLEEPVCEVSDVDYDILF
jgi:hypothetical protein